MAHPEAASSFEPKKVNWLWRERIPTGMLTVIAGKPDQGKGLVAAHIAADVSKRGGNVLYNAVEDDHGMMTRPRLEASGADLDRVFLWRFRLPAQFEELAQIVIENEIRLVVMDPFAACLSGGISRTSDSIRNVTTPLSGLAEETGCAFIIIEHALKRVAPNAHPLSCIGGASSGLPAACRMAFVLGVDPDDSDRRVMCCVKSNVRDRPKALTFEVDVEEYDIVGEVPALVVDEECEFDARRLLSQEPGGKPGRRPDKRAAAAEWLTQYLAAAATAGQPQVKAGEVMEDGKQYGLASKTIRRAADDMGVVRNPPGGGRNCTWELSDEVKAALGLPVPAGAADTADLSGEGED